MDSRTRSVMFVVLLAAGPCAHSLTLPIPAAGDDVVGAPQTVVAVHADTFPDLALRFNQGYREMKAANPGVDPWLPGEGTEVLIPSAYVLPDTPREGVVVNVPEMRLYFYPRARRGERPMVVTHPISVGRQDWRTPRGLTKVVAKVTDPAWYPPESIRAEHAANGDPLARVVPPGPDNPLGRHALRLGISGYLIHGTNRVFGIGMRVTHGCIRMYPDDIAALFPQIPVGTPVRMVNQRLKVGVAAGQLYVEVHPPLEEEVDGAQPERYRHAVDRIIARVGDRPARIDWRALAGAVAGARGVPVVVGSVGERGSVVAAN